MSKRLNHSLAIGIFLFGIFSANVSQAQTYTNVYWYPTSALGGTGSWSASGSLWSTNSNGSGTLSSPNTLGTNIIYNFSGTAGTVTSPSSITNGGINWLTSGYTLSAGNIIYSAVDQTLTGTNTVYITNNANLNITGLGVTFKGFSMTGGAGSTVTLTNAAGATTTVIFGNNSATSGRTNSVNTIIAGGGTIVLGTTGNNGFTQAGNITNNSTGTFVLTNSTTGTVNVAGAISGSGAVTLANTSSGNLQLSVSNSYSGGTFIQNPGGEVRILDSSAFGSGKVTINGAGTNYVRSMVNSLNIANAVEIANGSTLRLASTNTGWKNTYSGVISGGGGILYQYNDTEVLSNTNNSFGGGVNIATSVELQVASLGMKGANSSLGTNGSIMFSSQSGSGSAGSLVWMGTNSEASDKDFALTAVSSSVDKGMKIYAGSSSSGGTNVTLTLNGNINSTGTNNQTITLGAYNGNTLAMNGTINQAAGYTNSLVVGNSGAGTVVLGNTTNSFGGGLTINAGSSSTNTVQVAKIGNAGANSSLGTNGTINIGGSSSSGVNILKYVGTGETSDKVINLAGTTGGATLDQSGTGNLKFDSATTATGVGAKTITLQGSTAGTGELAGAISNLNGNVISLNKAGSGTWTLSGTNTYTGNTTISGGTLKMGLTNGLVNGVLIGSSSTDNGSTLDMTAAGDYVMKSYGASSATYGQNMVFTNSSGGGGNSTLTFTNANNYVSGGSAAARTLNNASTNLTVAFSGAVDIGSTNAGTYDVTFTGPGGFTINGSVTNSLSGVRGLTKSGDGTLTLNAASGYNGATTLSLGTIALGANGTLGTNSVIMSAGTLAVGTSSSTIKDLTVNGGGITGTGTLTSANSFTFANTTTNEVSAKLAGSGVLNKSGAGTTTLSGNNSYSGLTTVTAGTLTLSGSNSAASGGITLTAGALNVNSANALGSGTLTLTAGTINNTSGAAVVNAASNAVTLASGLNFGTSASTSSNDLDLGAGTVTVSTSRTLTLLGAGTTLKMGTLENTSANTSRTFTFDGASNNMVFRGFNIATTTTNATTNSLAGSANLTISGVIANGNLLANGVNIKSTGTTTFSGTNTYTGGTEVFSGATLVYGASNVTADTGAVVISGTMNIGAFNDTVASVKVSDGGSLTGSSGVLSAGSFSMYGANTVSAKLGGSSATLEKSTQDTVTLLSGANTYGGLTTVSGGTLKLGSSTALGSTAGATTVGTGGFLDLNGQTEVAETLNYTGTGGLLNRAAGTTATVSGAVDIGSGMTVETTGNITLSGQLTGSVSKNLTKSGAGTLKFTATNSTFNGTNTVSEGTLLVDTGASVASSKSVVNGGLLNVNGTAGDVMVNTNGILGGTGTVGALTLNKGGALNPGNSPGMLKAATATILGGSTYNWQIANLTGTAGTNWDLFSVTGLLDMSAVTSSDKWNLVVTADSGFAGWTDTSSRSYVFAQAASVSGFSDVVGTDITSLFNITATGIASLPNASFNANGDFKVVVGSAGSLTTLKLMAVPEPSTGALLGFGLGGLLLTRLLRRKQS